MPIKHMQQAADLVLADALRTGRYSPRRVFQRAARSARLSDSGWLVLLGYLREFSALSPAGRTAASSRAAVAPPCTETRAQQIDHMATLLLEHAENLSPGGAKDCDMGHEALMAALARRMGPADYADFLRSMASSNSR
jgi:hypothetical protein